MQLSGTWQGTLQAGERILRVIVRFPEGDTSRASLASVDEVGWAPAAAVDVNDVVLDGNSFRMLIGEMGAVYDGIVDAEGQSIKGAWTQGDRSIPLAFERTTKETEWRDPSPHCVRFVNVEPEVDLEVLDWGGAGTPVVLLAGGGDTAHVFDRFAPKLAARNRVYGITRRGFGASSAPQTGYSADRLGDDVLAVIEALGLDRPVVAGHSLGGQELSSIGSRYPEKVAGLVYLDAGWGYAYYDRDLGDLNLDLRDVRSKLGQLLAAFMERADALGLMVRELVETDLPRLARGLAAFLRELPPLSSTKGQVPRPPLPPVAYAISDGFQKYAEIHAPVLAIFAMTDPVPPGANEDDAARAASVARTTAMTRRVDAFERGIPSARVVRLPDADHYVFVSNEADVLREIHTFIDQLASPR